MSSSVISENGDPPAAALRGWADFFSITSRMAESSDEPFLTHICGTRVMANITVSPGRSGPIEVLVQLEDGDEKPLAVDALSVSLSNPDKGIAPVTATADSNSHHILA